MLPIRCLLVVLFLPCIAVAEDPQPGPNDPRLGQMVFWKAGARTQPAGLAAEKGKLPLPARVEKVDGQWLWLQRAWVHSDDVLLPADAIAYYSADSWRNPIPDSFGKGGNWRGNIK